ncbi:hypothetical protein M8845_10340 [Gelidibacter japonicus]|jgi:hypothetical protein|uniref:hypothetical protein n=1 Tax=Gelidibacter japonicus TaxID=1962232 RepID=UPI002021D1C0|nr:hypothetical protein [Gelidibacter japonicus]MCL8007823.1 hypothetical protein [Gelidibacter japonicus]
MSEEKVNTNITRKESISIVQDESLTSKANAGTTDSAPVLKAKAVKKETFSERMKTHRFLLVRAIYYFFYSIWAIVMAIGMFIAWLIAMLFI